MFTLHKCLFITGSCLTYNVGREAHRDETELVLQTFQIIVLWDMTSCSLQGGFAEICDLHLLGTLLRFRKQETTI
jgi:hypothetical protein